LHSYDHEDGDASDLLDDGKDADDMRGAFDFESKRAPAERKLLLKQCPCPALP
jgi:hypothetical protein